MEPRRRNLRVPAAAERTGLSQATIRKMIFLKKLPVVRIGRTVAIPEEAIEKIISDGYEEATPEKETVGV